VKHDDDQIPTLTDVVELESTPGLSPEQLAQLQAELTARVSRLAEELMHAASREVEAVLFERVFDRLRARLPELVDQVLKDQLMK
jgi:hypothetical protein